MDLVNGIQINGIHATYWKELCETPGNVAEPKGTKGNFKIFKRYVDAYMLAPILGVVYSRKASKNLPTVDDNAGMMTEIQIKERKKILYIYRLVLLMDPTEETPEQKINRVFRLDECDKVVEKNNMDIFHDYFKGGLEILHEKFVESCATREDYIDKIMEFVNGYNPSAEYIEGILN